MTEKQRQIKNTIIYTLPLIITSVLPLVTLPIFTRILTLNDYGNLGLAMVYASVAGGPLTGEPRAITRVNLDLISTLSVSVNTIPLIIQGVTDTVTSSEMAFNAFTGKKEFRLLGYSRDPRVEITQTAPLDLQINGMIVEVAF